jgi:hypothetical protein
MRTMMDGYWRERIDLIRARTGATDVQVDLLGVTLTIEGHVIVLSHDAIRAMSSLGNEVEQEALNKLRSDLQGVRR